MVAVPDFPLPTLLIFALALSLPMFVFFSESNSFHAISSEGDSNSFNKPSL